MNKLEHHKVFPYIAWATIILFVFFTYSLTLRLTETTQPLEAKTNQTVNALSE